MIDQLKLIEALPDEISAQSNFNLKSIELSGVVSIAHRDDYYTIAQATDPRINPLFLIVYEYDGYCDFVMATDGIKYRFLQKWAYQLKVVFRPSYPLFHAHIPSKDLVANWIKKYSAF